MQTVAPAKTISLLLWFLLSCQVERGDAGNRKKKTDDDSSKVSIPHHSFQTPLAYEQLLNDWTVGGASLVETERLLIHPSVSERAGFAFNKAPLLTNDFEAIVHFRVVGEKAAHKVALDQSFSVWYVYDNISAAYNETQLIKASSWKVGMEEQGMTFGGMKSKFTGFGAVFSMGDAAKRPKPVITGVWNDGNKELVYGVDAPSTSANAKAIDFRNTLNAAQFKIRVTPSSVEGFLKQSPSLSWTECFKLNQPIQAGGYLGFSAWSGQVAPEVIPDMFSVTKFEVYNYDTTSIGEEMKDVTKEIQDAYREMLTDENRHFADQKSQTEHIGRIIGMLSQHMETNSPADAKMFEDLELIQGRMGRLDEDCKTLVKELQILVEPKDGSGAEGNASLKDEIIGLRRLLVRDSAAHNQKLDVVKKNVAEVKQKHDDSTKPEVFDQMHSQVAKMETTVSQRGSQMTWMMVIIIGSIAAIGGLMYNRMSYYERKHFI